MQPKWKSWVHVTKLDPDKNLSPEALDMVASSGTDALMLSGTLNVTADKMRILLSSASSYGLPIVIEPSGPDVVILEGIDLLFVPSVLNTTDVRWVVGMHTEWVARQAIDWQRVVPEAYIVLNPDSSVGKVTRSRCHLSPQEVAAHAVVADHYFRFPIVYIEYSGTYGDPAVVKAAAEAIDQAVLYYGGGINSGTRAAEMSRYADTIVVGNMVYEGGAKILRETVTAVQ
ncbi:MAG: phosphoglycerol geranylgeranyltransferase [Methanomicrobiales archaeon]|nr:phosphoglycerol geranylgeranyltransferase [Methanomicrobiales archaeon]